uniref:RxLR effector candidate protein n=1 Tax=Hyaloperonospora arabidopsidis (strain Emoy2) TaxID=559515 RepID=M4BM94_HYAAE
MRLCSTAAEEAKTSNVAGDNQSAASSAQRAADAAVWSRGDAPRDIGDYELELIYSGKLDGDDDSKKPATKKEPDVANPKSTKLDSRSAMSLSECRDIFGSSDESNDPSPRRSCSLEFEKRTPTGARYKLHRLSKEAGLPCLYWGDACQCCASNIGTNSKGSLPNDRLLLILQSLYKRAGRSFSDGPSSALGVPCHTARQGPTHPSPIASEDPKYPPRADSRATGRGNSSDVLSHRGGSTVVLERSVDHRAYQPMDAVEEEIHLPMGTQDRSDAVSQFDRVTCELREDLEHEKGRRLDLLGNVNRLNSDREKDRA